MLGLGNATGPGRWWKQTDESDIYGYGVDFASSHLKYERLSAMRRNLLRAGIRQFFASNADKDQRSLSHLSPRYPSTSGVIPVQTTSAYIGVKKGTQSTTPCTSNPSFKNDNDDHTDDGDGWTIPRASHYEANEYNVNQSHPELMLGYLRNVQSARASSCAAYMAVCTRMLRPVRPRVQEPARAPQRDLDEPDSQPLVSVYQAAAECARVCILGAPRGLLDREFVPCRAADKARNRLPQGPRIEEVWKCLRCGCYGNQEASCRNGHHFDGRRLEVIASVHDTSSATRYDEFSVERDNGPYLEALRVSPAVIAATTINSVTASESHPLSDVTEIAHLSIAESAMGNVPDVAPFTVHTAVRAAPSVSTHPRTAVFISLQKRYGVISWLKQFLMVHRHRNCRGRGTTVRLSSLTRLRNYQ